MCLASIILAAVALATFFCCFIFGIPFGIAAVVTGIIGLNQTKGRPIGTDRTLAIVGICGGVLATVVMPALGLLFFTLPAFLGP